MGSTEDDMKRLLTRRHIEIPTELEAIAKAMEKLWKQRALLKKEKFDLDLEIDGLNKRRNKKTLLDLPVLVLQKVANCFGHPDEFLWKLSLASPSLESMITHEYSETVEAAIQEKSFSLLIKSYYLNEADIENLSNSSSPKLENLAEKCWRFLEEPRLTSIEFNKTDEIKAFLLKANQAKNPWEVFSRKSFEFDWGFEKQHWNTFTAATTKLLESFGNFMPNIYFRYRKYSNMSTFTRTVLATVPTLQTIKREGYDVGYAFITTKFQPRTLEKLCTWSENWSGIQLQLHFPDLGICRQLILGQVVSDSKCFKTLCTSLISDTISGEVYGYGYEKFHKQALAKNLDNIETLRLCSHIHVKTSLSFATQFKNLSHLTLMVRQYQFVDDTSFFDFPRGPLLPHLKSFTFSYNWSRTFLPIHKIFAVFPSIRNFQLEAVNYTKNGLIKEMKNSLEIDASKSTENHSVDLYHVYSQGRSPAVSNIWQLFENLVSISVTTMHENDNGISGTKRLLIEKFSRSDNTECNSKIVQYTSSNICHSP